jgi:hypothetical protein
MPRLALTCGLIHVFSLMYCQSKNDCYEIADFFKQHIDSKEQFGKFDTWKEVRKIRRCVSNHIIDLNSYENFSLNLANLANHISTDNDRNKILIYMIKIQPHLKGKLNGANKQTFLSTLKIEDKKIAKKTNLKMIRRNFDIGTYLQVLLLFSNNINERQKKEIIGFFESNDTLSRGQKSAKWQSALLLATQNDTAAENYLIKKLNKEIQVFGRMEINKFAKDLVSTKNRRLMDFIIDEFLMSDYRFWDLDYGHSDFDAAENILSKVIDSPVFDNSIAFANDEKKRISFIRQWFKENRHTYKIKP